MSQKNFEVNFEKRLEGNHLIINGHSKAQLFTLGSKCGGILI